MQWFILYFSLDNILEPLWNQRNGTHTNYPAYKRSLHAQVLFCVSAFFWTLKCSIKIKIILPNFEELSWPQLRKTLLSINHSLTVHSTICGQFDNNENSIFDFQVSKKLSKWPRPGREGSSPICQRRFRFLCWPRFHRGNSGLLASPCRATFSQVKKLKGLSISMMIRIL